MMCLSTDWLYEVLRDLIIWGGIIAIIRILVPMICGWIGFPLDGGVLRIINIVIGIICALFVLFLVFSLLGCLGGGLSLRRL